VARFFHKFGPGDLRGMEREQAIRAATVWLRSRGQEFGPLRFAGYAWDFRSGYGLWGGHFTRGLITIPTLGTLARVGEAGRSGAPPGYWLVHGWVVVFDPLDRVPECAEDCFAVWVSEPDGPARGRMPRPLEFECTVPLTGRLW
jgi:hypothetical protein